MKRSSGAVPSEARRIESGTFLLSEPERATRPVAPPGRPCADRAKRTIAAGIEELVLAQISKGLAGAEWIDQNGSPLGKRRHLELVRSGKLVGSRTGKLVLIKRADIDAYLAQHTTRTVDTTVDENEAVNDLLAQLGESK